VRADVAGLERRALGLLTREVYDYYAGGSGRQLDGAIPTAHALPAVVEALRGDQGRGGGEVFADGGIRTAEDVLAALALGARAVFLGRPVLWALACGGATGVYALLAGLTADLAHVMSLAGTPSVADVAGLARQPA
jgi:4-hydroxymandelate oxidase